MVGHEHDPGGAVKTGGGQCVEQLADGGIGDRDRAVELGEVLADFVGVRQVVGHGDVVGVRGLVAVARVGAVRFEEARGQEERLLAAGPVSQRVACSTTYSQ